MQRSTAGLEEKLEFNRREDLQEENDKCFSRYLLVEDGEQSTSQPSVNQVQLPHSCTQEKSQENPPQCTEEKQQ